MHFVANNKYVGEVVPGDVSYRLLRIGHLLTRLVVAVHRQADKKVHITFLCENGTLKTFRYDRHQRICTEFTIAPSWAEA